MVTTRRYLPGEVYTLRSPMIACSLMVISNVAGPEGDRSCITYAIVGDRGDLEIRTALVFDRNGAWLSDDWRDASEGAPSP
jgi:hypothetical protein